MPSFGPVLPSLLSLLSPPPLNWFSFIDLLRLLNGATVSAVFLPVGWHRGAGSTPNPPLALLAPAPRGTGPRTENNTRVRFGSQGEY